MRKLFTILLVVFAVSFTLDSYAQITYKINESFEGTWPPTGWTTINVSGSAVWAKSGEITTLFPPYPNGTSCAFINYTAPSGEDYLITPQIMNIVAGDSLVFRWVKQFSDGPYFYDSCVVRLSTTTNTPVSAFNKTLQRICVHCTPIGNQIWYRASVSLNAYIGQNVYIAFDHKDTDGHGMGLDVVQVKNNGVGINEVSNSSFTLHQNYPNPFSKSTMISYELKNNDLVKITVLDLLGKEVSILVNDNLTSGIHNVTFNAENLTPGVYFYKMETSDFNETKVMIVE